MVAGIRKHSTSPPSTFVLLRIPHAPARTPENDREARLSAEPLFVVPSPESQVLYALKPCAA